MDKLWPKDAAYKALTKDLGTTMNEQLNKLLTEHALSPKLKIVADYVVDHLQTCCFLSSLELAETLGISYSTVIRFTQQLGFSGYPEFQRFLRDIYIGSKGIINESIVIPVERLDEVNKCSKEMSTMDSVARYVLSNIQMTLADCSEKLLEQAGRLLLESDSKFILSSRACDSIADFLNIILRQTIPHVHHFVDRGQNIFDFVSDIGEGDCAIAISFPRYSRLTLLATEMAKKQGAKIVVITDKPTSVLAPYADVLLLARCESSSFHNSYVAPMLVAELLCVYLARMTNGSNRDVLKRIDEYTSQTGLF